MSDPIAAEFLRPGQPFAIVTLGTPAQLAGFLERLDTPPGALVEVLRGERCATAEGLFSEAAEVLDFPDYFGHNWNAFDDCLGSMPAPGQPVLLAVTDAHLLLTEAGPGALSNLAVVTENGNTAVGPSGEPRWLKLLLQVEPDLADALEQRLEDAGFGCTRIELAQV